jgi:hypothetical protein
VCGKALGGKQFGRLSGLLLRFCGGFSAGSPMGLLMQRLE